MQSIIVSLNSARAALLTALLKPLKDQGRLETAIDVGCGVGHFSDLLHSLGFQVTAATADKKTSRRHDGVT